MRERRGAKVVSEREAYRICLKELKKCKDDNRRLRAKLKELGYEEEMPTVKAKKTETEKGFHDADFTVKID